MQITSGPLRERRGKRGFTLVELMVVLAIVGVLVGIALQFKPGDEYARQASRRLGAALMSALDKPKLDALTGRAINVGTPENPNLINPGAVRIRISTGSVVTQYLSGTFTVANGALTSSGVAVMGTGTVLAWPFFGEKQYKVASFGVAKPDGSRVTLTGTDWLAVDMVGTQAFFSGSDARVAGAVGVQMVAEFQGWRTLVEMDMRSGRVGYYFNRYPGCDDPDIKLPNGQVWAACNVQQGGKGCGRSLCGLTGTGTEVFQWGYSDGSFKNSRENGDWTNGTNGPCAIGYHVPSRTEWADSLAAIGDATSLRKTLRLGNLSGLPFKNSANGNMATNGDLYWTSTTSGTSDAYAYGQASGISNAFTRAAGRPVRCIRNS